MKLLILKMLQAMRRRRSALLGTVCVLAASFASSQDITFSASAKTAVGVFIRGDNAGNFSSAKETVSGEVDARFANCTVFIAGNAYFNALAVNTGGSFSVVDGLGAELQEAYFTYRGYSLSAKSLLARYGELQRKQARHRRGKGDVFGNVFFRRRVLDSVFQTVCASARIVESDQESALFRSCRRGSRDLRYFKAGAEHREFKLCRSPKFLVSGARLFAVRILRLRRFAEPVVCIAYNTVG